MRLSPGRRYCTTYGGVLTEFLLGGPSLKMGDREPHLQSKFQVILDLTTFLKVKNVHTKCRISEVAVVESTIYAKSDALGRQISQADPY